MSDYTTGKGIYNGWYWRFVGLTSIGVILLMIVSVYTIKTWPVVQSTQIGMFVVIWLVISRITERRFLNALAGSLIVFLAGLLLEFTIDPHTKLIPAKLLWQDNLMVLVVGVLLAYLYAKMQGWSERKREQLEAKRKVKMGTTKPDKPQVRVHRKKKHRK